MKISIAFLYAIFTLSSVTANAQLATDCRSTEKKLTLQQLFALVEQVNPDLLAAHMQIEAAVGAAEQAGLAINPDLVIGFDEFAGSGQYKGTSSLKSSIGVKQQLLTAGKRNKRLNIAKSGQELSRLQLQQKVIELKTRVANDFLQVWLLQGLGTIQQQSLSLTRQAADAVEKRVLAGEAPAIDETRAKVELSSAEITERRLQRELETAQIELATSWNADSFDFAGVDIETSTIVNAQIPEPAAVNVGGFPEVAHGKALVRQKQQELALVKAEATPDLQLTTSFSKFRESRDQALAIEIEFELPLFDKKQGRRKEAMADKDKVSYELQSSQLAYTTRINALYRQIQSLRDELANIGARLLPMAARAHAETNQAYEEGERELIDMLDARRTYLEATRAHLTVQHELMCKVVEYAIITGAEAELPALKSTKEDKE